MIFTRTFVLLLLLFVAHTTHAQQLVRVETTDRGTQWQWPVAVESIDHMTVDDSHKHFRLHVSDDCVVPFAIDKIDRVTVNMPAEEETKDHHKVFAMYITTNDGTAVSSREEYKPCHISVNAQGAFSDFSATGQIRGRGNSSFLWYDKKPYRIKLDEKRKVLGLPKAKSWVLLANYRDITDLMNTFVFEMGEWMGLPFTNHTRYVELFINDDYKGIYQLTEQVQQNKNRVNISNERGILLTLDVDDGPDESPNAGDNFWSKVYHMPAAVKFPDEEFATAHTTDSVKAVFAELEQAIKSKDYALVDSLLDIPSFIKYLQIQEFIYNVELSAPRSIFLNKDGDGKWIMGPLWDFDAGYDFDWGTMTTGHNFFDDYHETVMGTDPLHRNGEYGYVPQFFTDLFGCPEFVEAYKAQWAAVKDSIVTRNWAECLKYVDNMRKGAREREDRRWTISNKHFDAEVEKMHQWLVNRCEFMTDLIANIPVPKTTPTGEESYCGTISTDVEMNWYSGFTQSAKVRVSKSEVAQLMGIQAKDMDESQLNIVGLDEDGNEGINGTNGKFGAWFDEDNAPGNFADGHTYIEIYDDLWNWSCGLYQNNCDDDDHTVTMQYQYPHNGKLLKVNVEVNFTISFGW